METIKVRENSEIPKNFTGIVEYIDGTKEWFLNGKLHRTDGPAIEWHDGEKAWWLNGKLHRIDGPAIEFPNGSKQWWLNGRFIYCLDPIGDYIVVGDGLPFTIEWLGEWTTALKVLTATGLVYILNLPGI